MDLRNRMVGLCYSGVDAAAAKAAAYKLLDEVALGANGILQKLELCLARNKVRMSTVL